MPLPKPYNGFKRPCRKCGKIYRPTGRYQKFCEKCKMNSRKFANLKQKGITYSYPHHRRSPNISSLPKNKQNKVTTK